MAKAQSVVRGGWDGFPNIAADGRGFSEMSLASNARNREEVNPVLAEAEAPGAKIVKPASVSST
jgi:hypothetical protein